MIGMIYRWPHTHHAAFLLLLWLVMLATILTHGLTIREQGRRITAIHRDMTMVLAHITWHSLPQAGCEICARRPSL